MAKRNPNRRQKILVRRCRADGITWFVPDNLKRVKNKGEVTGAKIAAFGEMLGGFASSGAAVQAQRYLTEREQAMRVAYCPVCGSPDWEQYKAREMPQTVDMQLAARVRPHPQMLQPPPPPLRQPPPPHIPPPPGPQQTLRLVT